MSHQIARTATNRAAMAFVGETPWHGLGQQLTENSPMSVWTVEAGFDWQAEMAVPSFTRADNTVGSFDGKRVIYRNDTGAPLSVMGAGYQIVQPREVLAFFESLIKGGDFKLHTAGVLNGGRRMWALARNGHGGEIVKGDPVDQYLMLATSLDGSTPTVAAFTTVRVVCANTIAVALREADSTIGAERKSGASIKRAVKVSHKSVFDAGAVKLQMDLAGDVWAQFLADTQAMADKSCSVDEARHILRDIFGQPLTRKGAAEAAKETAQVIAKVKGAETFADLMGRPMQAADTAAETLTAKGGAALMAELLAKGDKEQKSVARCLELFGGAGRGADHAGVKGTRWGLLNAVTEHIDHEQGRMADTRLSSAWFGRGADFKQATFDALRVA